ncbi:MAG: SDR family oxidoreductase [Candidatus Omnitrophica bacterium]|nr:SDR family oxidoreductase [Candidatus Omnitrophota bacterium]
MNNDKKIALVTGAAQGIGKCIALTLLEGGWEVVIADIDEEAGREALAELAPRGKVSYFNCDVADENSVIRLFEQFEELYSGLDLLVNNAGIMITKPIQKITYGEWSRVIAVNLGGAFLCSKYAAEKLRLVKGCIINISSTRALMSEPDTESYSASKGGMLALTHSLAVSLGPDIRVNCISPGWIEVSDWKKSENRKTPRLTEEDHSQHPAGRVGSPQDIALAVKFLSDPGNSFMTGENLIIDGGMTRKMIYL